MTSRVIVLAFLLLASCDKPAKLTQAEVIKRSTLTLVSDDTWRDVAAVVCKPIRVDACGVEGCKEGKPVVTVRWEPKGGYQRCDNDGCDSYSPVVSHSGIWTELALPQNGMMAKFTADGYYMEVATINDTALVYHGQCERVKNR